MAPTIDYIEGFGHFADTAAVASGTPVYTSVNNPGGTSITYVAGRTGGYCLDINEGGASGTNYRISLTATQQAIWGMWFCFPDSAGAANTDSRMFSIMDGSSALMAYFSSLTAGGIRCRVGGGSGTVQDSSGTYADGSWHFLEFQFTSNGTTWTMDWRIDGVAQTQCSEGGHAATDQVVHFYGSGTAAHNAHFQLDDVIRSVTNGEYPLSQYLSSQEWAVRMKVPTGDGTHSTGTNNVRGDGAETTNLYQKVDDWATGAVAANDYLTYTSTTTGDAASRYAEVTLANLDGDEEAIWGARALAATISAGTGSNSMRARLVDASNNTLADPCDDVSETTVRYHRVIATTPSGGWLTDFNGLKFRIGLCNLDTNPLPRIAAVGVEYVAVFPVAPPPPTYTVGLYKRVAGSDTLLAEEELVSFPTLPAVMRFEIVDDELVGKFDGSTVVTVTDSAITGGIKAGAGAIVNTTTGSVNTDAALDSFEAGLFAISGSVLTRTPSLPAGSLLNILTATALSRSRSLPSGDIAVNAYPIFGLETTRTRQMDPGTVVFSVVASALSRSRSLPQGALASAIIGVSLTRTRELSSGVVGDIATQTVGLPIGF